MELVNQPPNSPDLNVLDLGFFNAIQSLQHQKAPTSMGDLVASIEEAYWEMQQDAVNSIFLTLQKVMECVMECEGKNMYKFPHTRKGHLRKLGRVPLAVVCSEDAIQAALEKMT